MKFVFVTGSSRSGTTMLGRLLGKHQKVFTFPELHFFEQIVSDEQFCDFSAIDDELLVGAGARLINVIEKGYLNSRTIDDDAREKSRSIIRKFGISNYKHLYTTILSYFINDSSVKVAVEQTPRYIFSIAALSKIDDAKIIHMVRDPRSVLISQKYKWKRKFLGASQLSRFESIRSFISYDPILTSLIWRKATKVAESNNDNDQLLLIRFESLIENPNIVVESICHHVGITFSPDLLLIPVVGSSKRNNSNELGISSQVLDPSFGGIGWFERRLCEFLCGEAMRRFNYQYRRFSIIETIFLIPIFALMGLKTLVQGCVIFVLNRHRYTNVFTSVIKRLT